MQYMKFMDVFLCHDHTSVCPVQGYHGCAIGKAKQNAKTEIEKIKMKDMSIKDLVKEAAKMQVSSSHGVTISLIYR